MCLDFCLSFSQIYVFLWTINCIKFVVCLLVMGINSHLKYFMELMEGHSGVRIMLIIASNVLLIVFGTPPPIVL